MALLKDLANDVGGVLYFVQKFLEKGGGTHQRRRYLPYLYASGVSYGAHRSLYLKCHSQSIVAAHGGDHILVGYDTVSKAFADRGGVDHELGKIYAPFVNNILNLAIDLVQEKGIGIDPPHQFVPEGVLDGGETDCLGKLPYLGASELFLEDAH